MPENEKVIKTTFKLRRGNAATFAANNPILAQGEPAYELDTNKLKIGDGVTAYNNLEYVAEGQLLGENGKILAEYLPSYVDDVLNGTYVNSTRFNNEYGQPYVPMTGVIYVDTVTNKTYRWSGEVYVRVDEGETVHNNLLGRDATNAHPASAITTYNPYSEDTEPLPNVIDALVSEFDAKQDTLIAGTNITIAADGKTISATGGGEPAAYLKSASVSGNTLTLLDKTDTPTTFTAVKPQTLNTDTTTTTATLAAAAGNDYVYTQELTSLALSFGTGTHGDIVNIAFKSGATATNLTISGSNYATDISTIDANSIIEISAKYVIDRWCVWAKGTAIA